MSSSKLRGRKIDSTPSSDACDDDDENLLGLSTVNIDDILVRLGGESLKSAEKQSSQSSNTKRIDDDIINDSPAKNKILAPVRNKLVTVSSPSVPKEPVQRS